MGWIASRSGSDIHDPQRMYLSGLNDSLTFPVEPPAGQIFYSSSEISQQLLNGLCTINLSKPGQISPKIMNISVGCILSSEPVGLYCIELEINYQKQCCQRNLTGWEEHTVMKTKD